VAPGEAERRLGPPARCFVTDQSEPGTALHADSIVGVYRLVREIGHGGMSTVWLAMRTDALTTRPIALKLPHLYLQGAEFVDRFARERDILANLTHPNIAHLYDAGISPRGQPFLAMEFVAGDTLTQYCEAHRLSIDERLGLFLQVLAAVAYAHSQSIIHRDLKPSNILVREGGHVVLLDFGIAKLLVDGAAGESELTRQAGATLTPEYASPEQIKGEPLGPATDVYSLGILLYELLTGRRPYGQARSTRRDLEDAILSADPRAPSEAVASAGPSGVTSVAPEVLRKALKGDLDTIVLKALHKQPEHRYPTVNAFAEDLRRYLNHRAIRARPDTLGQLRGFTSRHRRLLQLGAAAGVMLLAGALAWLAAETGYFWHSPLARAKFTRLLDFPGTEQAAAMSRDGKFAAFVGDRDGQIDAWVSEVGSGTYRNLTHGEVRNLINPPIRVLGFSVDSSLVTVWTRLRDGSQPGDVSILAVPTGGGPLRPYLREAGEFAWSRDGKRLVYHTTAPGDPMFVRESAERGDRRIYVAPAGVHCHFPIWSSDDAFIYFVRGVPPDEWDIWRIQPSGAGLERITFHNTRVAYPVILDRRTLLYLATDADGSGPWMYAMDVERRTPHRIGSGLETYTSLAASADGARLVATTVNPRTSVWRLPLTEDGAAASVAGDPSLVLANGVAPRLGADFLLYVSWRGERQGIWSLAHGTAREIWSSAHSRIVGGPAIAPDGRHIAFSGEDKGTTRLYTMDNDGSHVRVLADSLALRGNPGWAPDGQSIVSAVVRDGEPRLTRFFLNGDSPLPLVAEYSIDPVWSPDGRFLVYSGADVGTAFPLRAAAADGRPYPLPSVMLSRGARRVAFFRDPQTLVILSGEIGHKNFSLLDLRTGAQRPLAELPADFVILDFDISTTGSEIVLDRVQVNSDLALIERTR
jgi:serine/threonine protein kinase/Tol biopolymer transport system component